MLTEPTNYLAYDVLGRVASSQQITAAQTYNFSYSYNLAGSLTSETYPSGRVMNTAYDGANRESQVSDVIAGLVTNYISSATYAPHGEPT